VITEYTQFGKINENKAQKQIIEAVEQCERLDIPTLHPVQKLTETNFIEPTYAAIERSNSSLFKSIQDNSMGLMIGPEGGFSDAETQWLSQQSAIRPVSLGENILRAETAALFMLSRIEK
jgi:16S rRNA (uracil1498-N3)-methyltransferase